EKVVRPRRTVYVLLRLFFFQAEDGIRDFHVTGVQTCALPICRGRRRHDGEGAVHAVTGRDAHGGASRRRSGVRCSSGLVLGAVRSEERRVGKEGITRWALEPKHDYTTRMALARCVDHIERAEW